MEKFTELIDLAAARVGGKALSANDEFFAPKENLLKPGRGLFIPDKYTSRGKWMDGWETRRRRTPGFDWCVLRLGLRGVVRGVNIDTNHFLGNYPQEASLEACDVKGAVPPRGALWTELLPKSALAGGAENLFRVADARPWSHVRLNIFPDGGVARLRVHGDVVPDWKKRGGLVDLAAVVNGGLAVLASDMFFGHRNNLIMPGRAKNMGDGWETKRRRGPGYDWIVVRLGAPGTIEKVEVDTNHFKGNYPDSCSLEGCRAPGAAAEELAGASWSELLPRVKLRAHERRFFARELAARGPFTHVRLNIYPDGGVSRLRLYGRPERA